MNTLFFRYAIEVEKTRSISQAAENLFMAQPNLSKAIREIEDTLGFPVFRRTSKGVIPTQQGREFLVIARNIVSQLEKIDTIAADDASQIQSFRISIPRASYISEGFLRFSAGLDRSRGIDINVRETSSMNTITAITGGTYNLGIIRYRPEDEKYFLDYLAEKNLSYDTIWEYEYLVMMSKENQLCDAIALNEAMLEEYPEIIHNDNTVPYISTPRAVIEKSSYSAGKRITVYERANQFEILMRIPTAYMWVSPVPGATAARYDLVLRRCADSTRRFKDVLIYPSGYKFTLLDRQFIDRLYEARNDVAYQDYN